MKQINSSPELWWEDRNKTCTNHGEEWLWIEEILMIYKACGYPIGRSQQFCVRKLKERALKAIRFYFGFH